MAYVYNLAGKGILFRSKKIPLRGDTVHYR